MHIVSGRISVRGCLSQDVSCLISLSLCAPRFQVSVCIWCIYQHVRTVICLSVCGAGLDIPGVAWVVFLRSGL